jgi:hypothetical protein
MNGHFDKVWAFILKAEKAVVREVAYMCPIL